MAWMVLVATLLGRRICDDIGPAPTVGSQDYGVDQRRWQLLKLLERSKFVGFRDRA